MYGPYIRCLITKQGIKGIIFDITHKLVFGGWLIFYFLWKRWERQRNFTEKSTQRHEIIRQISEDQIFHCVYALISHASNAMLKILQARFQWYVNHELPDVQAGFRKGRRTRDQIANICWIIEKASEFQEKISILL